MKLTIILLFALCIQVSARVYSQQISLSVKNSTLKQVFNQIKKQTGYSFLWDEGILRKAKPVSFTVKDAGIEDVMSECLRNQSLTYTIDKRLIVVKAAAAEISDATPVPPPPADISLSGRVTNTKKEPLEGVSVTVKGTQMGTTTNADGRFQLSVPSANNTELVFSFVGYTTQTVKAGSRTVFEIVLEEMVSDLSDVVVVGYGTQKKINLTGAVSVASKDIFENRILPNSIAALQGEIPGVTITRSSGRTGNEGYAVQIRGLTSANNVDVLVLIDGTVGSLIDLNPNDIESVSVLKDAAASAIYGSNASGGVILVTTKKGQSGKTVFEYSGMYGISNPGRMPHSTSAYNQFSTLNIGNANKGAPGLVFDDPVKMAWYKGERLDEPDKEGAYVKYYEPYGYFFVDPSRPNVWQSANSVNLVDQYTKGNNPLQTHNFSIRGGNDKNSFFLSSGYYNQRGMLRYGPDDYEKYHLRLNIRNELNKYISLNSSVAFTNNNTFLPAINADGNNTTSVFFQAYRGWSSGVTYGPTGDYFASHGLWQSYVQEEKEGGRNTDRTYNFDAKANLTIKNLIKGFELNIIGAKNYRANKNLTERRTLTYMGPLGTPTLIANSPNFVSKNSSLGDYTSLQLFGTYNYSIRNSHNFKILGGYSYEDFRSDAILTRAQNLTTNDFFSLNWGNPNGKTNTDAVVTWATLAFFGRVNYNFKEKYLFEGNLRYDGSSRLAPENRWNTFPSLSAGWNIDKENFFRNMGIDAIQNLKLRASWGQLGNSNAIGYYDYIGLLNAKTNLPFNNNPTQYIYQTKLASPTKTWEIVTTENIGLDLTAFAGRLSFSADAYIKKNKNMLSEMEVPSLIGIGLPTYNVGELETRGWELEVSWRNMSKSFKYWITGNLSDNKNKLIKYSGKNIVQPGVVKLIEGMPLNTLWGYKTDDLFRSEQAFKDYDVFISPKTGVGDMKYIDLDGDKKITPGTGTLSDHGDLVFLGDNGPRYNFGLNLGFQWKGLDFNTFFQGVGKRKFFPHQWMLTSMLNATLMPFEEQLDYWTKENPDAFWPRPFVDGDQSYWSSDYWIQNAAYIRLKNIELGYSLPLPLLKRLGMNKFRVFVNGQNLWESTKTFSYIDPESPEGVSWIYPFYRTVSFGVNIQF